MLNLERNVLLAAIGAGSSPLFQQIFSQFVAEERPLLVVAPLNLWMLHLLQIKANQPHADQLVGAAPQQALVARHHVCVLPLVEGRPPASTSLPIVGAPPPVAGPPPPQLGARGSRRRRQTR